MPIGLPHIANRRTRKAGVILMQKKEIWKPVVGSQIYKVSNHGRVKSLSRFTIDSLGIRRWRKGKILSPRIERKGHLRVALCEHSKQRNYLIHRLVYEAFIGNIPNGYVVHHIDGDKNNNAVSNLQIMSVSDHSSHHHVGFTLSKDARKRISEANRGRKITDEQRRKISMAHKGRKFSEEHLEKLRKRASCVPVIQYTPDGEIVTEHRSLHEAARKVGGNAISISNCCRGKRKTHKGFRWAYANKENDNEKNG